MDLFIINRYDEDANKNDPTKEERILKKLQKTIEEKKSKKKIKKQEEKIIEYEKIPEYIPFEDNVQTEHMQVEYLQENKNDEKRIGDGSDNVKEIVGQSNYIVLGQDKFDNRKKIDMILPSWLAYPTIVSTDLSEKTSVKNLIYLTKSTKISLKALGVESFFPVQTHIVPWILSAHAKPTPFWPRDICVSAPTGSGKTLAFAVPIVQILQNCFEKKIRALIVLPVQELANQVAKIFRELCKFTKLVCTLLSSSVKLAVEQKAIIEEINGNYYSKTDIIVTTAGRLVEHLHSTKGFSLKNLKFLVVDEADRVMQEIQNDWLYHVNKHVQEESAIITGRSVPLNLSELWNDESRPPHKLLFSATLSPDPEKLKTLNLFQPKLFTASVDYKLKDGNKIVSKQKTDDSLEKYTIPMELSQNYCYTEIKYRPLTLVALIKEYNWKKFLCFTNDKKTAHRLSLLLQKLFKEDLVIEELSSHLFPKVRQNILNKFAAGTINGLICSDALARGIDVSNCDIVVSYEPAYQLPTYIHRIGRTARAGKSGTAVTLVTESEYAKFYDMVKEINGPKLQELQYDGSVLEKMSDDYSEALRSLNVAMKTEKQLNNMKKLKAVHQKPVKSDETKEMGLLEKLQSNIPAIDVLFNVPKIMNVKHQLNLPDSWKSNVTAKLDNGAGIDNAERVNLKKKIRKEKRKNNLKKKLESMIVT